MGEAMPLLAILVTLFVGLMTAGAGVLTSILALCVRVWLALRQDRRTTSYEQRHEREVRALERQVELQERERRKRRLTELPGRELSETEIRGRIERLEEFLGTEMAEETRRASATMSTAEE